MIKNLQDDVDHYRLMQIDSLIEKNRQSIFEDPICQCYLTMINANLQLAFKEYLLQLIDYGRSLPLPSKNELAVAFSQSFIPTNTPFIRQHRSIKKIVEKINQNVLLYFKKKYEELRQEFCPKIEKNLKDSDFSKCICAINQKTKTPKNIPAATVMVCFMCHLSYHNTCLRVKNITDKQFVCPQCILFNMDPLHQVDKILGYNILEARSSGEKSAQIGFQIENLNLKQQIDIRCLRLDGQRYEQAWPDIGDLIVNGSTAVKFQPLTVRSSLKYRKDDQYSITHPKIGQHRVVLRQQSSNQSMREKFKVSTDQLFYFGAYLINEITPEELIGKYKFDKSKWLSIQQMKDNIYMYSTLNQSNDVVVNKISVNLVCQLTSLQIKLPCRGALCEHIQCFCLESYSKILASLQQRKWNCPICKKICLEFSIDGYQYCILQSLKNLKNKKLNLEQLIQNVNFDKNGHYLDNYLENTISNENFGGRNYLYEIYYQKKLSKGELIIKQ